MKENKNPILYIMYGLYVKYNPQTKYNIYKLFIFNFKLFLIVRMINIRVALMIDGEKFVKNI